MAINIGILVPTYNRPKEILKRTLISALSQKLMFNKEEQKQINIKILICSDTEQNEESVLEVISELDSDNIEYFTLGYHSNNFANSVRQFLIDQAKTKEIDFILFLDDDNIIFPDYIKTSLEVLLKEEVDFVVSEILHLGPLPMWHGSPPKILKCNNLTVQNCDTLQFFCKAQIIFEHKWLTEGDYLADGYTFQSIAKNYTHTQTNKLLGVHI